MSKSYKLIPKLIETCVFLSSPGIDKGVNKNSNTLITNKPIVEIEKPKLKSRGYSIGYTQLPEIYSARNKRDNSLLLMFSFSN